MTCSTVHQTQSLDSWSFFAFLCSDLNTHCEELCCVHTLELSLPPGCFGSGTVTVHLLSTAASSKTYNKHQSRTVVALNHNHCPHFLCLQCIIAVKSDRNVTSESCSVLLSVVYQTQWRGNVLFYLD